jgi:hypothetical protein
MARWRETLTLLYCTLTFVLRTVKDCPLRHHGGLGLLQGPAEIPDDLVTQLRVKPLAWRICPWQLFSETQSISVAMKRWSVEHRAFAVEAYFKNNDSVVTQRIFRRHFNIHRNDSGPSRSTSSFKDISRVSCTKRNQGQRWIWNITSGKKWQQFLTTCCNEWSSTSRSACGNVLTSDVTSHTLCSGSESCN